MLGKPGRVGDLLRGVVLALSGVTALGCSVPRAVDRPLAEGGQASTEPRRDRSKSPTRGADARTESEATAGVVASPSRRETEPRSIPLVVMGSVVAAGGVVGGMVGLIVSVQREYPAEDGGWEKLGFTTLSVLGVATGFVAGTAMIVVGATPAGSPQSPVRAGVVRVEVGLGQASAAIAF